MKTSEQTNDIAAALAKAQKSIEPVIKGKTATVNSRKGLGSSYSYAYADLASIWAACRSSLTDQDIAVAQSPEVNGQQVTITTRLMHSSGQWIEGSMQLNAGDTAIQVIGSAITYGRRYALMAFLGIAPEDDDGGKAQAAAENAASRQQQSRQSSSQSIGKRIEEKPAAVSTAPEPGSSTKPPKDPPAERIRAALKRAHCQKLSQARLVLQWATDGVFGGEDPLKAIEDDAVAKSTLQRIIDLHKKYELKPEDWLPAAEAWRDQRATQTQGEQA